MVGFAPILEPTMRNTPFFLAAALIASLGVPSTTEAAPVFPVVLEGDYCEIGLTGDCAPVVLHSWVLEGDGTYTEGTLGFHGDWSFSGGTLTLVDSGGRWAYRGSLSGDCMVGMWVNLPFTGEIAGEWRGCF
jgi:hypothetical protein